MGFMKFIMTLEYSTLIGINLVTFKLKVCNIILYIYVFYGINIVFSIPSFPLQ